MKSLIHDSGKSITFYGFEEGEIEKLDLPSLIELIIGKDEKWGASKTVDYNVLREQLVLLAINFGSCSNVNESIDSIEDKASFRRAYKETFESIAMKFDIQTLKEKQDDIDNLEDELHSANNEVQKLRLEIEKYDGFGNLDNVMDEWKARTFSQHKDNYTYLELEELFTKGKEFLNQK